MAGEMAGSHFSGGGGGGPKTAGKWAGKMAGQPKFGDFWAVRPFSRPFFGHFWDPEKVAAGHFAGHFPAIFGSGPVFHSVAGQPSPKSFRIFSI